MVGDRIRHARTYHGWSQGDLAQMIGKSQPAISAIEKGKPASADMSATIAKQTQFAPWFFERGVSPTCQSGAFGIESEPLLVCGMTREYSCPRTTDD